MNEVNVGIIAAIISAIGLFTVWLFNYIMLRHTQAMEHNRMLLDINKMVIEYPELWTILESDTSQCSSETSGRRNAFMFLILNTGCQIFIDLNSLKFKSKLDKEKWKAWINP
ncbi:hypothetical protein ABES11_08695 [Bacillus paranthracis]|uniref:hypothetical protein n=1 Tax=Bacillus paranthracis TaxID=2026186 RepID=UPI003D1EB69D